MVRGTDKSFESQELGLGRRLRRRLRVRAEKVLDRFGLVEPRPEAEAPEAPWTDAPAVATPAPKAAPPAEVQQAPDAAGEASAGGLTFEAVQEMFDDMVRPALQSDGGDITLREVVDGEVRVTLVGACSTCPSAILTMKDGIERLLEDEFEDFRSLVQVEG